MHPQLSARHLPVSADGARAKALYLKVLCLPTAPVLSVGNSSHFGSWLLYDNTRALQYPRP